MVQNEIKYEIKYLKFHFDFNQIGNNFVHLAKTKLSPFLLQHTLFSAFHPTTNPFEQIHIIIQWEKIYIQSLKRITVLFSILGMRRGRHSIQQK
jgi:hypothetical protein